MPTKTVRKPVATPATTAASAKKMSYTFQNGATIKGTMEQIVAYGKLTNQKIDMSKITGNSVPKGYYNSSSKGLIKISEMHDTHLRNAIVKNATAALTSLQNSKLTNKQFLVRWTMAGSSALIAELVAELNKR
jgi:hypothetical protein